MRGPVFHAVGELAGEDVMHHVSSGGRIVPLLATLLGLGSLLVLSQLVLVGTAEAQTVTPSVTGTPPTAISTITGTPPTVTATTTPTVTTTSTVTVTGTVPTTAPTVTGTLPTATGTGVVTATSTRTITVTGTLPTVSGTPIATSTATVIGTPSTATVTVTGTLPTATATVTGTLPTATITVTPTRTRTPTATILTNIGGRGFNLTDQGNGAVALAWRTGTGQSGYRLDRITSQGSQVVSTPAATATSTTDTLGATSQVACYQLETLGTGTTVLGRSDVLCLLASFPGGTGPVRNLNITTNESPLVTLTWQAPSGGGQIGYLVVPLGRSPLAILPATATQAVDVTVQPTCYMVLTLVSDSAQVPFRIGGFSSIVCAVPGMAQ